MGWPLSHPEDCITSCIWIGPAPGLADPSRLPHSKLKRYIRSEEFLREVEPPPPVLVGDTLEYEVEGILWHQGTGARRQYLVLWKGYPLTEATWEPESHLTNAPDILEEYLRWVEARNRGKRHSGGVLSRS